MAQTELNYQVFDSVGDSMTPLEGPVIASAATISPVSYITEITGTVQVGTITVPYAGFSGTLCLIFTDANPGVTLTSGNIAIASTPVQKKALLVTYVPGLAKWCPSY